MMLVNKYFYELNIIKRLLLGSDHLLLFQMQYLGKASTQDNKEDVQHCKYSTAF